MAINNVYLCENCRHRIVEVYHALGLQILVALRGVGAAIYRGVVAHELADAVLRLAGCCQVVEDHGEFVLIQCFVDISDVAVEHVEQPVQLHHDDTVALGMTLGLDQIDAVLNFLTLREVVVRPVGIAHRHEVRQTLQLNSVLSLAIQHLRCPFNAPSSVVRYMSAICSLLVRYLFGLLADKYRTSTEHIPHNNRSYSLATL